MDIGRKVYYEKTTGNIILITSEMSGDVIPSTREQDFNSYGALSGRDPETVGLIELEYGQYAEEFTKAAGYRVNPDSRSLEFSYPDANSPEEPPVYQAPLTEQVAQLQAETAALNLAIIDVWETIAGGGA